MLNKGTRVRVNIPESETTVSRAVRQFSGRVTRITDVKHTYLKKTASLYTYTLAGCVSDFGIPYEFMEAWLVPQDF